MKAAEKVQLYISGISIYNSNFVPSCKILPFRSLSCWLSSRFNVNVTYFLVALHSSIF